MSIPMAVVLRRGGEFFMGESPIQHAARRIASQLADLNIPYAIICGIAVGRYGHLRYTEDVDVLISADGLKAFKDACLGLGWVEKFPGSKGVRDARHKVNIDFLVAGERAGRDPSGPVISRILTKRGNALTGISSRRGCPF